MKSIRCQRLNLLWFSALAAFRTAALAAGLPEPGIGVFFKPAEVAEMRAKVERSPCQFLYQQMLRQAEAALAKWPQDQPQIASLAPRLPDLTMEFVPQEFAPQGGKAAGKALEDYATQGAPAAAFAYLITGERRYAAFAWEVFEQCGRVPRWGWFPWSGSHLPQIHFGTVSRNLVFIADAVWDALTSAQRKQARAVIAEKCVEPYFRLVLHTPGMGLYHLRSRNQGNNALAAALIGSLFVGDTVAENKIWFCSLLQTYHWAITHDIGWMGQGLEMDLGGYWSVSMQNLYTAAVALANVKAIDLRVHPGFEQGTFFPLIHEATVPPVGLFAEPIDPKVTPAVMGIIDDKPIGLPGEPGGAAWWFDYATRFPDSPARYFAARLVHDSRPRPEEAHQAMLGRILFIAWWNEQVRTPGPPPTALALFTDRMAGIRSGYCFGDTYLYFNGDLFLSAKKEILGTTSGMAWHFPWHQYQITESGIETEGELFAPSMTLREARQDAQFAFFRAEADFSNVSYYPQAGQRESHTHYAKRSRSVLYARASQGRPDYFVFADEVQLKTNAPRWHAWTWHLWNAAANPRNGGRFVPQGASAVRAERPNADLWIQFLPVTRPAQGQALPAPSVFAFEQHGIPSQPHVNYQMDHNALMLRAMAGGYESVAANPVTIPPPAWQDLGIVEDNVLFLAKPPTMRPDGAAQGPSGQGEASTGVIPGITGGLRYRWSLKSKQENYRVYEATAWEVGLELLDAQGRLLAAPTTRYGQPHPLKLGAPLSDTPTHDWTETAGYFDAPANAASCRATFRAIGGAHYFKLGKLWLGPIELRPLGRPHRQVDQEFLTLVMPLEKGAPPPQVVTGQDGVMRLIQSGGAEDEIALAQDRALRLIRREKGRVVGSFSSQGLQATAPTDDLKSNSEASARKLAAGLKPVLEELAAERDALTRQGRKNLALGAKVTASAFRDERFTPDKVRDNQTAEYPTDGHLDYTQGIVWTSGRFAGYGAGKESLLRERDYFPLYVRPTYWLLPEQQLGWVELALPEPAAISLVRVLNTSNAGLNDFATRAFRIELYDHRHELLASRDGAFGQVFDRPFQAAFVRPKWFDHYTPTFASMLEPGVTVPFGDGWQEIRFTGTKKVAFIRVVIMQFWGLGGGLNEVQVY